MGRWVWGKGCVVQDQPAWWTRLATSLLSRFTHLAQLAACKGLHQLVRPAVAVGLGAKVCARAVHMQRREGKEVHQRAGQQLGCRSLHMSGIRTQGSLVAEAWLCAGTCRGEGKSMRYMQPGCALGGMPTEANAAQSAGSTRASAAGFSTSASCSTHAHTAHQLSATKQHPSNSPLSHNVLMNTNHKPCFFPIAALQ